MREHSLSHGRRQSMREEEKQRQATDLRKGVSGRRWTKSTGSTSGSLSSRVILLPGTGRVTEAMSQIRRHAECALQLKRLSARRTSVLTEDSESHAGVHAPPVGGVRRRRRHHHRGGGQLAQYSVSSAPIPQFRSYVHVRNKFQEQKTMSAKKNRAIQQ